VGEIQCGNFYAVGPGSYIDRDKGGNPLDQVLHYEILDPSPVSFLSKGQIEEIFKDYIQHEDTTSEDQEIAKENGTFAELPFNVKDLVDLNQMKKAGEEYYGPHPVHGSETRHNFWIKPEQNVWHCFRCNSGGGPWQLLAVLEGIMDCKDSKRGALKGEKFKQVVEIAKRRSWFLAITKWRQKRG
jgi:hypothetical protein